MKSEFLTKFEAFLTGIDDLEESNSMIEKSITVKDTQIESVERQIEDKRKYLIMLKKQCSTTIDLNTNLKNTLSTKKPKYKLFKNNR